ncbi:MAG: response regulator, partial [Desulfarculaceae bacterium]
ISTLLSTAGYKVDEAVNGPEGLKKLQEKKPDLVTLDMMMPQESGVKLYRDIKTSDQFRDIPVLVISGLAKKTFLHSQKVLDKFKGQQVPEPEAYIEKPAEPDELLAEVQRLLPS